MHYFYSNYIDHVDVYFCFHSHMISCVRTFTNVLPSFLIKGGHIREFSFPSTGLTWQWWFQGLWSSAHVCLICRYNLNLCFFIFNWIVFRPLIIRNCSQISLNFILHGLLFNRECLRFCFMKVIQDELDRVTKAQLFKIRVFFPRYISKRSSVNPQFFSILTSLISWLYLKYEKTLWGGTFSRERP